MRRAFVKFWMSFIRVAGSISCWQCPPKDLSSRKRCIELTWWERIRSIRDGMMTHHLYFSKWTEMDPTVSLYLSGRTILISKAPPTTLGHPSKRGIKLQMRMKGSKNSSFQYHRMTSMAECSSILTKVKSLLASLLGLISSINSIRTWSSSIWSCQT